MTDKPLVPPVLYLPLHRDSTEENRLVETRELKDGRLALLAYTAYAREDRDDRDDRRGTPRVAGRTGSVGTIHQGMT